MESMFTMANWPVSAAIIIFIVTFILIVTGIVHRTYASLGGALLMVVLGIAEAGSAFAYHINWKTIGLLFGLMIMIGITNKTGLFSYLAVKIAQLAKGKPETLFLLVSGLAAVGAAWLDNLTIILLLVPITLSIARVLQVSAVPYVIALTISANIGGTATVIGSLPNMLIGTTAGLTFNDFLLNLGPPVLIILVISLLLLLLFYKGGWKKTREHTKELMQINAASHLGEKALIYKTLSVWVLVLAVFLLHPLLQVSVTYTALAGALLLLLLNMTKSRWEDVTQSVDWYTLFYIIGLFILVGGLSDTGVMRSLTLKLMELTSGNLLFASLLILWVTGLVSATMDSMPFIMFMIPLIKELGLQSQGAMNPLWWSLALGAGIGGSGTLIGATANLIAAGLAGRDGQLITFSKFLKAGAPITLVSLLIATAYVMYIY
jgi:Na+/H+ antiporter NhaD/arsenite permease-like protein